MAKRKKESIYTVREMIEYLAKNSDWDSPLYFAEEDTQSDFELDFPIVGIKTGISKDGRKYTMFVGQSQ